MKKVFISFAIVAAGLFVASCGNKSEKAAGTDEATQESAAEASDATKAECNFFSLNVPSGWTVNSNVSDEKVVSLDAPDLGQFESLYLALNDEGQKADKMVEEYMANNSSLKKVDDVTFGKYTFKQLKHEDSADYNCELFTDVDKGVLHITLSRNMPIDNAKVKEAIESITLK